MSVPRRQDDPWFWRKAVPVLSLDVMRFFFEDMGLRPPEPAQFQRILRESIVEGNPSKASGRKAPDATEWLSTLRARLQTAFGTSFLEHLSEWMFSVLFPAEDLPYNAWRLILSPASRSPERWSGLGFSPDHAERLRQQYLESTNIDAVQRSIAETRAQVLSEWDLAIFALHNLYDEEDDPFSEIVNAVRRHRLFRFWNELELSTSWEERSHILQNAQDYAKSKSMSVTLTPLSKRD